MYPLGWHVTHARPPIPCGAPDDGWTKANDTPVLWWHCEHWPGEWPDGGVWHAWQFALDPG